MLNPGNMSTLNTNMINKQEIMDYVKKYNLFEGVE